MAFLGPGLAHHGARLPGEDVGPVPFTVRHGHQGLLPQRLCDDLGRAGLLAEAGRIGQAASPPSRSPERTRATPCISAGPGVTMPAAANLATASSASASIQVKEKLLFSGLKVRADGKVVREARVASTATEAQQRASDLRPELTRRHVHPDVLRFCRAELLQQNYFHAVLEASKNVADKLRVGWPGGISPPGSHRSRRDTLASPGSSCSRRTAG